MARILSLLLITAVLMVLAVLVFPVIAQEDGETEKSLERMTVQSGDDVFHQYESRARSGGGVVSSADIVSVSRSFQRGYSSAGRASSAGARSGGDLFGAWRSDAMEKYNPAVDDGKVPGFVSQVVERRMIVRLNDEDGGDAAEEEDATDESVDESVSRLNDPGGVSPGQLALEPTYIVAVDELTGADGEILEDLVDNWGSGEAYRDGELSASTVLRAAENYRDEMVARNSETQTTCMTEDGTFVTSVADCNREGGASLGSCATPSSSETGSGEEVETPVVEDLDEIESDKPDSELTEKEKKLQKEVKKKWVDEKDYVEETNDCEDFAHLTGLNLLYKDYDAGMKTFFYETPNGTSGHAIVIVRMDKDGDGNKENVYVEPQTGNVVELNESKIKEQNHFFGEEAMNEELKNQTELEINDDDFTDAEKKERESENGGGKGSISGGQMALEPMYIVGMDRLTGADGEIVESVVENWGSGDEQGEISTAAIIKAAENYRDAMVERNKETQTTCLMGSGSFTTSAADCNRKGGASVGSCATPTSSDASSTRSTDTPVVDGLDEVESDKDDSDLTEREEELQEDVKNKSVDEMGYVEGARDCEDFALMTGLNLLEKGYDAGMKYLSYETPNGTKAHMIVIVSMDRDGDGNKESVYVEPQTGNIVQLNESKIKKQRHHFGESSMKKEWRHQTELEATYNDSGTDSRASEAESIRNIAVRTDADGKVTSMSVLNGDGDGTFNHQVTIVTDVDTIENIRKSDRPTEVARAALKHGEIEIKGKNLGASLKTGIGSMVGRATAPDGPESIYGEENLHESPLGYQYVDSGSDEEEDRDGVSVVVDPNNGGREGFTTEGTQKLLEKGGTQGLSPNAGIYASVYPGISSKSGSLGGY